MWFSLTLEKKEMKFKIPFLLILSLLLAHFHAKCQVREIIQAIPQKIDTNGVFQKKGHHFFLGLGFPNLVFTGSDLANSIFQLGYDTKKEGLLTYTAGYEYGLSPPSIAECGWF